MENGIHTLGPGIQMTESVDFLINRRNSKNRVRPKRNFVGRFTLYDQNYISTGVILPAKVQKHQKQEKIVTFKKKSKCG